MAFAEMVMSTTHTIFVNRKSYQVTVDHSETPILYVLRNDLALKGTRFGCGSGECGACMVLIDGRALCLPKTPNAAMSQDFSPLAEFLVGTGISHACLIAGSLPLDVELCYFAYP